MSNKSGRITSILLAILLIPVGLFTKVYTGPFQDWVQYSLGGVLYVIFFSLVLFFLYPNLKPFINVVIIVSGTCCIEFLQLWKTQFLEYIRSFPLGRILLGTSFSVSDLIYTCAAGLMALPIINLLYQGSKNGESTHVRSQDTD